MSTKQWIGDKMYIVDEEVREYIEKLEAELAEHQWVSVEDRLPDSEQLTLVLLESGNIIQACDADWCRPFKETVTHWKPIHLPKKESESNG